MSYKVFARKWRPLNFAQVVGQEHIVRALVNALENDRLHHAYLFTGTRGVGKTTIARVLAKALNCENKTGAEPCGECSTCLDIDQGHYPDLIEVDAASRTGVDDTRDLLENVQYAPTIGKYKVYLIDEVHMFSKSSFNALLKTLEEPPEHVKFLLATTDPQKMPVTVLSRCLQFNLKRLTPEQILGQFKFILDNEGLAYQQTSLELLARAADGSMRDGLSLLDQAIVHGQGELNEADVLDMLGSVAREPVLDVLNALTTGNGQTVLETVAKLDEFAPDYADVLQMMLSFLHKVALYQIAPNIETMPGVDQLASKISKEDVQLYYQIGLIGQSDLPLAPSPKIGFEMVLLRMLAFRPAEVSAQQPEQKPAAMSSPVIPTSPQKPVVPVINTPEPVVATSPAAVREAPPKTTRPRIQVPGVEPVTKAVPKLKVAEKKTLKNTVEPVEKIDLADENQQVSSAANEAEPVVSVKEKPLLVDGLAWHEIVPELKVDPITLQLANNSQLISLSDKTCELNITAGYISVNENGPARLEKALSDYFKRPLKLVLQQSSKAVVTPNAIKDEKTQQRYQQAEQEIVENPAVKKMVELFDAKVVEGSVRPLD